MILSVDNINRALREMEIFLPRQQHSTTSPTIVKTKKKKSKM